MTAAQPYDGTAQAWDAFVARCTDAPHAARTSWARMLDEQFAFPTIRVATRDSAGELRAGLVLSEVPSLSGARTLLSSPYVSYGGPFGAREDAPALVAAAIDIARSRGCRSMQLRSLEPLPIDLPALQTKSTVLLTLGDSADAAFKTFPSKLRSQIRRPTKEGAAVRFGADQIDAFGSVFHRHMRDLGSPALPLSFFRRMATNFSGSTEVAVVYLREQPIAAGFGFYHGDRFEIAWASALMEFRSISANMLLYWSLMQRVIDRGYAVFDFGRGTPGSSSFGFKLQWGGEQRPLYWYTWSPGGAPRTVSSDSRYYDLVASVWRRLPVPVASSIGARLIRRIQ